MKELMNSLTNVLPWLQLMALALIGFELREIRRKK